MFNLSVNYDPAQTTPEFSSVDNTAELAVLKLYDHKIPVTLQTVAPVQKHFRDAIIAHTLIQSSPTGLENVLKTLTAKLRSTPDNSSEELVTCCEITATIAYSAGDLRLAKETLLRVNPQKVTSLLKNIYEGLQRQIPAEIFKDMIVRSGTIAIQEWHSIQDSI
jgi:hypothetical protein